jgi:predicted amidohydrolase YtcJ
LPASLIFHNVRVLTMEPARPQAEAVAVAGDRLLAVGSGAWVARRRGAQTRLIDGQGMALLPGFIDAHCHLLSYAASLLSVDCSPRAIRSIGDIRAALAAAAAHTPEGRWLRAVGYDETDLAEGRHPTRWDLDAAVARHPVRLMHRTGRACVLNSRAMSLVGLHAGSEEPPGGFIERDPASGEPTGLLLEMNDVVDPFVPPLSYEELSAGVRQAAQVFLSQGVTAVQDATATNGSQEWELFRRLMAEGCLPLSVTLMEGYRHLGELPEADGALPLRRGPVKVVIAELGEELHPGSEELEDIVWRVHQARRQVALHAVGEAAVAAAARALAAALRRRPYRDHRHRIEHCGVCPPALAGRLAALGVVVVTQPTFVYHNGDRYLRHVPAQDLPHLYPLRTLLEAGVPLAAGSDAPVAPPGVVSGLVGAVRRLSSGGATVTPGQAIPAEQALAMHTCAAGHAAFEEGMHGSLRTGKRADLVLLSGDPLSGAPTDALRVEMTVVGGQIAWQRGDVGPGHRTHPDASQTP